MYLHSTSRSLAQRCCLHNIILISHDKCATTKPNIHHCLGALSPSVGRSAVNYRHGLSADNASWGTAVTYWRNPISKKTSLRMCPGTGGAPGTTAPELGWAAAFQSHDAQLVWIAAGQAARAGSPVCLHPSWLPKWEGRGAGDDEEGSYESPELASRVS